MVEKDERQRRQERQGNLKKLVKLHDADVTEFFSDCFTINKELTK